MSDNLSIDVEFEDGGFMGRLDDMVLFVNDRLQGVLAETSEAIIDVMSTYPPSVAVRRSRGGGLKSLREYRTKSARTSYYDRTGSLGESWRYKLDDFGGGDQQSLIWNTQSYAPYVHGSAGQHQLAYHAATGWANTESVVRTIAGAAATANASPDIDLQQVLNKVGEDLKKFIETGQSGRLARPAHAK